MKLKRKVITVQFEFFKNISPDDLEKSLRQLSKKNRIPQFSKIMIMVHHKNLKPIPANDRFPLVLNKGEINKIVEE